MLYVLINVWICSYSQLASATSRHTNLFSAGSSEVPWTVEESFLRFSLFTSTAKFNSTDQYPGVSLS